MKRLRFMPSTDKYYAKLFLVNFSVVLGAMLGLIVVIDAFQRGDEFIYYAKQSETGLFSMLSLVFQYYATQAPALLVQYMLPLISILAGVITVTYSAMHNEYTVLRSSGVSLQRAVLPVLLPAVMIIYFVELSRDYFLPRLMMRGNEISATIRPQSARPIAITKRDNDEIRSISMGHFDLKGFAHNLQIEIRKVDKFNNNSRAFVYYYAPKAALAPRLTVDDDNDQRQWEWKPLLVDRDDVRGPVMKRFGDFRRFPETEWTEPLPTYVTEAMLRRQVLGEAIMSGAELKMLADDELDAKLELYRRSTEPWAAGMLLFIGLSLVLKLTAMGREPSYTHNIVIAILLCLGFYIVREGFMGWGEREILPAFIAAWLPVMMFAGAGGWLYRNLEH